VVEWVPLLVPIGRTLVEGLLSGRAAEYFLRTGDHARIRKADSEKSTAEWMIHQVETGSASSRQRHSPRPSCAVA
jgi:hypothetical protein